MSEQALFKSVTIGGFNKDDVLHYIDRLGETHKKENEDNEKIISDLQNEVTNYKEQNILMEEKLDEVTSNFDELMSTYEELRQHYLSLKDRCSNLETINERLKSRCQKNEKEISLLSSDNEALDKKVKKAKKIVSRINDVNDNAIDIISYAKATATAIVSDTKNSVQNVNRDIDKFCEEIESTRKLLQNSLEVMTKRLDSIKNEAENAKIDTTLEDETEEKIEVKFKEITEELSAKADSQKQSLFR